MTKAIIQARRLLLLPRSVLAGTISKRSHDSMPPDPVEARFMPHSLNIHPRPVIFRILDPVLSNTP